MKVLYVRVSTADQNTDRQRVKASDYNLTVEDRCSGTVPFFERPGGREILGYINKDLIKSISVWQIDRLGRNILDILTTIKFFNDHNICIHFINQGLKTLEQDGSENAIAKLIISILGIVGEMERTQIRERTREGIRLAKARGAYKGRVSDSKEDPLAFLSKEKNKKAVDYLRKGYKASEAAKLADIHPNTVCKIKKYLKALPA